MEQSQWTILRQTIRHVTRSMPKLPRVQYGDCLIACLYFWAVLHDRPMTWAVERCNYNRSFRPRKIPSISQLNRRIASARFQGILQRVHQQLAGDSRFKALVIDGQALCVGPVSQDRDARVGHIPGGMGRGYKLHAIVCSDGSIPLFSIMPLNTHETPVARQMLAMLRHDLAGTLVFADGNYDAHRLHKQIARQGGFFITHPRRGGARRRERGNHGHPVTRRQMGRSRRLLIDLWENAPALMERVYRHRQQIERRFGNLSCIPGLLTSLPKFVRSLPRVRRFVGAKICLYHAHRIARTDARRRL